MEENKNDFNFDVEDVDEARKREKREKKEAKDSSEKPNIGLIIGIAAGALAVIVAVIVACVFLLGGCEHIDADDDYLCDRCGEHFDDGDNEVQTSSATVKFTVKVKGGAAVSGVKLKIFNSAGAYTLTTAADGTASLTLDVGKYEIEYDTDTMPEYHLASTYEVTVSETTTALTLELTDNTPDGSADKPFFLPEKINSVSVPANTEYYYSFHGTSDAHLEVRGESAVVTLDGDRHTPVGGVTTVYFGDTIGTSVVFSIKNTAAQQSAFEVALVSPLGSRDNPIEITDSSKVVTIEERGSVHYKWTAPESGILLLRSSNPANNIGLTNLATNATSANTAGALGAYLTVNAGESVLIAVSATTDEAEEIDFSLEVYEGTASDPLPIITDSVDISLANGASFTFSYSFGSARSLTVSDPDITLDIGGSIKTPDSLGMIIIEGISGDGTFTVTNTSEEQNGVQILFE